MGGIDGEDALEWQEACRREEAISDLLRRHPGQLTVAAVDSVADALGLGRATVYRLIVRYRASRTVSALMANAPGRRRGSQFLKPEQEAVIQEAIKGLYLKPTRPPMNCVVEEVRANCRRAGLSPPNWRTVKSRIEKIPARVRALRRGDAELISATRPTPANDVSPPTAIAA